MDPLLAATVYTHVSSEVRAALSRILLERLRSQDGGPAGGVTLPWSEVSAAASEDQAAAIAAAIPQVVPPDEVQGLTEDVLAEAQRQQRRIRDERLEQARRTFRAAMVFLGGGAVVLLVAMGLLAAGVSTVAVGSVTAAGTLAEIASGFLLKLYREANDRLDVEGQRLSEIESTQVAFSLIQKISDDDKRDDAIRILAATISAPRSTAVTQSGKDPA